MISILIGLFAAGARILNGMGVPLTVPLMAASAAVSAWYGLDPVDYWDWAAVIYIAVGCTMALQAGFVDWKKFGNSQIGHYSICLSPAIVCASLDLVSTIWLLNYLCAIILAGLAHPVLAWIDSKRSFYYTRYAEGLAGFLVVWPWSIA